MIKTLSLSENHRFRALYGKGKSKAGRYIVVYCMKNRRPVNRLGLTVSKKIGNAVTRNRIRRRMREAYRLNEAGFKSGFDIVIVARHGCGEAPFSALEGEMRALFAGLNMTGGGTNG